MVRDRWVFEKRVAGILMFRREVLTHSGWSATPELHVVQEDKFWGRS